MIFHLSYVELRYDSAAGCVQGIRKQLSLGWRLVELRGLAAGPYLVLFGKDDPQ